MSEESERRKTRWRRRRRRSWGGDVLSERVVCLVFLSWVLGLS